MRPRRTHAANKLEFELNIVPIIDCFTILITFLLSSGAFIAIGNLSVVVSGGGESAGNKTDAVNLTLFVDETMQMRLEVSGVLQKKVSLNPMSGKRDLAGLKQELAQIQEKFPSQKALTLEAKSEVPYEELIHVMEAIKNTHPDVLLGGF